MRRLYFLLPDVEHAKIVVNELLLARIGERHIHAVAKEGMELEDIPEATLMQKSDFVPALERGVTIGGATGLFAGLLALSLPTGLILGGGALLTMALAGAGIGAWMSSMIGTDVPNSRLHAFEEAIAEGEVLMIVDVPKARIDEITELVKQHHPEAEIGGAEPTVPAFP
jgi:hypothetical protein